jgi:hypothetical protein
MSTAWLCCDEGKRPGVLSGQAYWGVNHIDVSRKWVDVQGGALISLLSKKLEAEGLMLESTPSFDSITVAGAVSTASHGSQPSRPSLSSSVLQMELVLPNTTQITVSKKNPRTKHHLGALMAGMGNFGFIENVVLKVVPLQRYLRSDYSFPFIVDASYEHATHQEVLQDDKQGSNIENRPTSNPASTTTQQSIQQVNSLIEQYIHSGNWITLQFSPLCDQMLVKSAKTWNDSAEPEELVLQTSTESSLISTHFTSRWAKHHMRLVQPWLKLTAERGGLTSTIMPSICAIMSLPGSFVETGNRAMLVSRANGAQTQVEYYIKREFAGEALAALKAALRRAHESNRINFNGFVTTTFVGREETPFLAPSFRYNSAAIEITNFYQGNNVELVKLIEATLEPFEPLPHLGMFHTLSADVIKARYGTDRIRQFSRSLLAFDPSGKHMTRWKKAYTMDVRPANFGSGIKH